MNLSLTHIPSSELADFAGLPDAVKQEVNGWIRALAPALREGCRIGQALHEAAGQLGVSTATARRKLDALRESGWRGLINRSRCPIVEDVLPLEFVEYWKSLCERNQRKCKPAYRELIRRLNSGEVVPGYSTLPAADPFTGVPRGWTYRNLMRHQPSKFELSAARIGRSAAAAHRPLVFTTRMGLRVGQFYLFDDLWHDHKVNVVGQRQSRRPLEFHCVDLFSACKFGWGIKPALENEITGSEERLKERDMRFLLANVLGAHGYHPEGTTLVVEHGTAAIRADVEGLLHDLSDGLIKVARSGMEGASSFAGQYAGRSKGNFRFKAALESLGNLVHNEMAMLPGQMGRNRDESPEELHGRDRHNDALLRAMAALPSQQAELLRLPFMDFNQFMMIVGEIYRRINARTDHELEGWLEAGLVANEFRLSLDTPWQSGEQLLALPDAQRAAIQPFLDSTPGLIRSRRMSPTEVFKRDSKHLIRLPAHGVALILGNDLGVERGVRSGMFEFQDQEAGPGIFRYLAQVQRQDGSQQMLREGERYLTILNPFEPSFLYVCNARGGYLGAAPRWESVSRGDAEALHRACGRAAKVEAALLAPVARRGAEVTRRRIDDARHNAGILGRKSPVSKLPESDDLNAATERTSELDEEFSSEEIAGLFAGERKNNQGELINEI